MASQEDATKREILSLVGILQHAAKVILPGRTFVGRMYEAAAKVQELDYFTRLNTNFRSDLYWWHIFITHWNGTCFLPLSTPTLSIQTDASGLWGGGGFFNGKWFQIQWQKDTNHNGKRGNANCSELCHLGLLSIKAVYTVSMRQYRCHGSHQKELHKGTCSDESIAHIMVFCSPFRYCTAH